jgi:hypothetical protein
MMLYTAIKLQVQTQLLQFSSLEHYTSILVANMFWTDIADAVPSSFTRKSQDYSREQ